MVNHTLRSRGPVRRSPAASLVALGLLLAAILAAASGPATICYYVQPNPYLNDHAPEIKKILDGFFFVVGDWATVTQRFLGSATTPPQNREWVDMARKNLAALRKAGVTENFLAVSFNENGAWPSAETLLSGSFSKTMAQEFSAIGKVAKSLGFRGVSIDLEYAYHRYSVDHKIYTYKGYTVGDLVKAAYEQGYHNTVALLDAFPEAPVLLLPGELRTRPIGRAYMLGLMKAMTDRNAPGGFHFTAEYTYCLQDPVTNLATPRFEDAAIEEVAGPAVAAYWKRSCTMAPGVWPLHLVETGGKDYPHQPWKKEVSELREQMAAIRTIAKRWVWTFSGQPTWYIHSPELESKYGLKKQDLKRDDIDLRDWHKILADKPVLPGNSPLMPLAAAVRKFDRGGLGPEELCDVFGTPGRWWVLGLLGNPRTQPQFAAAEALGNPIDPYTTYHGRDGAVRWFRFNNYDPRGTTSGRYVFDYRNFNDASAHFVSFIRNPRTRNAILHVGWENGIIVRLGDKIVFDGSDYPARGRQMLYLDKYRFEKHVPFTLPQGKTRLAVTSLNSKGRLSFGVRITDEKDIPFPDVRFRIE